MRRRCFCDWIQRELDGATANEKVYVEVSEQMGAHGYQWTSRRCSGNLKKNQSRFSPLPCCCIPDVICSFGRVRSCFCFAFCHVWILLSCTGSAMCLFLKVVNATWNFPWRWFSAMLSKRQVPPLRQSQTRRTGVNKELVSLSLTLMVSWMGWMLKGVQVRDPSAEISTGGKERERKHFLFFFFLEERKHFHESDHCL